MTIYEPVTDIGKAIAKALTRDDGIRLDVHDILERWEPEYVADMEKAEKWDWLTKKDPLLPYDFDKLVKTDKTPVLLSDEAYCDFVDRTQKLEAVKKHLTTWVSGHLDWQMGRMSQWKKELDEIVEAED